MQPIRSILIANRGEIARRIIRTCRKMGIRSVAVYSDADRGAPFVREADIAVHLKGNQAAESYLHQDKLIEAARRTGAEAVHPGYGFLSENAAFARRCREEGLIFIGPNPKAIESMGSKALAKEIMSQHGVPVVPGYRGKDQSLDHLARQAVDLGFPVLLKASAGGGGKGMRIVKDENQLEQAILSAKREAGKSFGNEELIIEKYFSGIRHIEFQIFGDQHGQVVHLFERECTIQRRYQKIVEESPSPVLSGTMRSQMGEAAVQAAKAIHYDNAGTVEFIFTGTGDFYFLEVNTRLQVEHPVTEMITGLDLVEWQIRVAEGGPLPLKQEEVSSKGYALECRLYAEDTQNGFLPAPGTVLRWEAPAVEGLRWDTAVENGTVISPFYDPMIAKGIAWGHNRREAIRKLEYGLKNLTCLGLTTNQKFLLRLIEHPDFLLGHYDTHFIPDQWEHFGEEEQLPEHYFPAGIAVMLFRILERKNRPTVLSALPPGWRNNFYQFQEEHLRIFDQEYTFLYRYQEEAIEFLGEDRSFIARSPILEREWIFFELDDIWHRFFIVREGDIYYLHSTEHGTIPVRWLSRFPEAGDEKIPGRYESPMPGEVVKVLVRSGEEVKAGTPLLILSSMKMENTMVAEEDGTVEEVFVQEGQHVEAGRVLLQFKHQE